MWDSSLSTAAISNHVCKSYRIWVIWSISLPSHDREVKAGGGMEGEDNVRGVERKFLRQLKVPNKSVADSIHCGIVVVTRLDTICLCSPVLFISSSHRLPPISMKLISRNVHPSASVTTIINHLNPFQDSSTNRWKTPILRFQTVKCLQPMVYCCFVTSALWPK